MARTRGKPLSQRAVQWALQEAKRMPVSRDRVESTPAKLLRPHHLEGGTDLVFTRADGS